MHTPGAHTAQRMRLAVAGETNATASVAPDAPLQIAHANIASPVGGVEGRTVFDHLGSGNCATYHYIKDHLGSTRLVVNEAMEVVEATSYLAYGTMVRPDGAPVSGAEEGREKFTGKEFDQEGAQNGVGGIQGYHFGARVYDPEVGVWQSADPSDQYWNSYSYVGGAPTARIDPDGRFAFGLFIQLVGLVNSYIGNTHGSGNPNIFTNGTLSGVGGVGIGVGYDAGQKGVYTEVAGERARPGWERQQSTGSFTITVGAQPAWAREAQISLAELMFLNSPLVSMSDVQFAGVGIGPLNLRELMGESGGAETDVDLREVARDIWNSTPLALLTDAEAREELGDFLQSDDAGALIATIPPLAVARSVPLASKMVPFVNPRTGALQWRCVQTGRFVCNSAYGAAKTWITGALEVRSSVAAAKAAQMAAQKMNAVNEANSLFDALMLLIRR